MQNRCEIIAIIMSDNLVNDEIKRMLSEAILVGNSSALRKIIEYYYTLKKLHDMLPLIYERGCLSSPKITDQAKCVSDLIQQILHEMD